MVGPPADAGEQKGVVLILGPTASGKSRLAIEVAKELDPAQNVVTVLCDTGERYFSLAEYFQ